MKSITFDMDGTIADLYGTPNWLPEILDSNAAPYSNARPLVNMGKLARHLNKLQKNGYKLCIVSWGSKNSTENFLQDTQAAKKQWLARHLKSVHWDSVEVVPYGTPKSTVCPYYDNEAILFDDEEGNRAEWGENAFSDKQIFEVLKIL